MLSDDTVDSNSESNDEESSDEDSSEEQTFPNDEGHGDVCNGLNQRVNI